ncbi:MAG: prepilin peptidase [Pseudomonadota bacterium]
MEDIAPFAALLRFDPAYPPGAARLFLIFALPVWLYMAWYDMARLKILNGLVLFVLAVFLLLGPLVLPFSAYMGQLLQALIVFVVIFALYAAGAMGGGDAKFIAAAAPFFMAEDIFLILSLFLACALAAFAVHRLFLVAGADRALPLWQSWRSGRRFPLGFALGGVLTIYLALAAF